MSTFNRFILLLFVCISCFHCSILADELQEEGNPLQDYFSRCRKDILQPEAVQMCDTFLQMAREAGDSKMEIFAAALKMDCYYFRSDEENILRQVDVVKKLSKTYGNPYYYYFAWGNRLITFYIKQNQMNIALYEVNKMLKEAQLEDYKPGIAECYRAFAVIYLAESAYQLAMEYYQKEIDIYENEGIKNVNLPVEYSSLAECAIQLKQPDRAQEAIEKGIAHVDTTVAYQIFIMEKAKFFLSLYKEDFEKALEELQKMEKLCVENKNMNRFLDSLHDTQLRYYRATKQSSKALEIIQQLKDEEPYRSTAYLSNYLKKETGDIYWEIGDFTAAARVYRDYIQVNDTLRPKSMLNAISEFNTILEVELLQKEKDALLLDLRQKQLHVTYLVIAFMFVLALAGWLFFIRIYRLNYRLRESEAELRIAKNKAEQASLMKSDFIRSMSHEVRTPLNAIVGFSQVLSDSFSDDDETKEYADIIFKNSNDLLRLIGDVLELSALDQTDDLVDDVVEDINIACENSIIQVSLETNQEVKPIFTPSYHGLMIRTNSIRVTQVLTHLLNNAVKFAGPEKVTLSYEIIDGQIVYSVTDKGMGIPEQNQEVVFERFVKLNSFIQGTGLGLALCRVVAQKLGGNLLIDKEYKDGCRFLLTLPFIPVTDENN